MKTEKNRICKEARRRMVGGESLLEIIDGELSTFHDAVIERMEYDEATQTLSVDVGAVWVIGEEDYRRFRFTFGGYLEVDWNHTTGSTFIWELFIFNEGRNNCLHTQFQDVLDVVSETIEVEELNVNVRE